MEDILAKFKGLKALVVGDVMIDAYYFGKVDRISPEAPVPVVAVQQKESRLGGAANVAMNLKALGAKPIVCSVIGHDKDGDDLIDLFKAQEIGVSGIVQSKERVTTVKLRVIAQSHQMLRIDSEDITPINSVDSFELVKRIHELLIDADVLIFEDYDKGVLTQQNIKQIITEAHKKGIPVVVDPKKQNFSYYEGADLFKPNLKELKDGLKTDIDLQHKPQFEEAIKNMMQQMKLKYAMITLSEKGVMCSNGQDFTYIPAHIRKIADVSGAGDTVISVAALCMVLNMSMQEVAAISNLAGGLVCEEVGVVPINVTTFAEELKLLQLN